MARRIVRTIVQLILLSITFLTLLFFLGDHYSFLPSRIHNLLPEHHAGVVITDITYESCSSLALFSCSPGEGWMRINKDVYLGKGWVTQGFVQIKHKKEEELNGDKVVVDIKVGRLEPASEGSGDGKWEARPAGIWIKRASKANEDVLTGVDVLFGPDAAEVRTGWVLREGSLTVGDSARITARKGPPPPAEKKPILRFGEKHKFKVIQVSGWLPREVLELGTTLMLR
jgi:hypothetical protein